MASFNPTDLQSPALKVQSPSIPQKVATIKQPTPQIQQPKPVAAPLIQQPIIQSQSYTSPIPQVAPIQRTPATSPVIGKDSVIKMRQTMDDSVLMHNVYNSDPAFKAKIDGMRPFYQSQSPDWQARFPTFALNKYYGINPQLPKDSTTNTLLSNLGDQVKNTEPNYFSQIGQGVGKDFQSAASGLNEASANYHYGRQGLASSVLQGAGALSGGVSNVLSEPLKPILSPFLSALGDFIQKEPMLIGPIISYLQSKGNDLAISHPELAKNLQAASQIASLPLAMQGTESMINSIGKGVESLGKNTANFVENTGGVGGVAASQSEINQSVSKVGGGLKKAIGVDPVRNALNDQYQSAISKQKTGLDLAQPKLSGKAIDQAASDGILAEDGKGNVTGYSGATPRQVEIGKTLDETPGFDPNKPGASIAAAKTRIASLSEEARAELTKQNAGKINEFQTQRYQNAAVKSLRSDLTTAMEHPDTTIDFTSAAEKADLQETANQLENQYKSFLSKSGEREVAKLDLRQWLDQKIPNTAYSKSLAELPAPLRARMIFRSVINDSIETNAKAIGGQYETLMRPISNLFKGIESMSTHLPSSQQSLVDQFTAGGVLKLPNESFKTVGEAMKVGATKILKTAGKRALLGAEAGLGFHLTQ